MSIHQWTSPVANGVLSKLKVNYFFFIRNKILNYKRLINLKLVAGHHWTRPLVNGLDSCVLWNRLIYSNGLAHSAMGLVYSAMKKRGVVRES